MQMVSTPTVASKFLHLKYLNIYLFRWNFASTYLYADYDIFSLVSFLDASPCLETFHLDAPMRRREHDSIFEDPPSQLGRIPGQCYANLRCFVGKETYMEAPKALAAIQTYIEGKVPSTAKLNVVEPCSRCPACPLT
uniref:At1g61320/AtMIF1 LRR domain-containing protein n=1 Tax=Aegilops tauschii subsp. strangulata TaxID=200361 RepID=A0A453L791_AEGTS